MENDFIKAIFNNTKQKEIRAYFKGGQNAIYTYNILEMLKTDKDIDYIIDNETGEIIFEK